MENKTDKSGLLISNIITSIIFVIVAVLFEFIRSIENEVGLTMFGREFSKLGLLVVSTSKIITIPIYICIISSLFIKEKYLNNTRISGKINSRFIQLILVLFVFYVYSVIRYPGGNLAAHHPSQIEKNIIK